MSRYKESGVDLAEAADVKRQIKKIAGKTYQKGVLAGIGPFGAMFDLSEILAKYHNPVLVSTTDGVGTKLKIAQMMNSQVTIGMDLVNHCINDALCQGAKPLFFLDYIAQDKLRASEVLKLIEGMSHSCGEANVSLIGGEIAQMPGTYRDQECDVVGTMIGVVERHKIIDGHLIRPGDKILGLPSSGLHTNGYSLARDILFRRKKWSPYFYFKELGGQLGRALLAAHKSYLKPISLLFEHRDDIGLHFVIHGIAHITGGGFEENIKRILPEGCGARIRLNSWPVLPIFQFIQKRGRVSSKEMYKVFNMGIGMVIVVSALQAPRVFEVLWQKGQPVYEMGEIVEGGREVSFYKRRRKNG